MGKERGGHGKSHTPERKPENPKEGYRSLSTWFSYGLVELVYIEASLRLRRELPSPTRQGSV